MMIWTDELSTDVAKKEKIIMCSKVRKIVNYQKKVFEIIVAYF